MRLRPSVSCRKRAGKPVKFTRGQPIAKPCTHTSQGRFVSWRITYACAVPFAGCACQRSPPGSSGCGSKPLFQLRCSKRVGPKPGRIHSALSFALTSRRRVGRR